MSRPAKLSLQSWSWILTATVFLLFFLAGMTTRWATHSRPTSPNDATDAEPSRARQPHPAIHTDGRTQTERRAVGTQRNRFSDCALANFYAGHPDLAMKVPAVLEEVLRIKLANLAQTRIEAGDRAVASRLASCLQPGQRVAAADE